MKIRIVLKSPDAITDQVNRAISDVMPDDVPDSDKRDVLRENLKLSVWHKLERWISYKEYVTIEFDLAAGTAIVLDRNE